MKGSERPRASWALPHCPYLTPPPESLPCRKPQLALPRTLEAEATQPPGHWPTSYVGSVSLVALLATASQSRERLPCARELVRALSSALCSGRPVVCLGDLSRNSQSRAGAQSIGTKPPGGARQASPAIRPWHLPAQGPIMNTKYSQPRHNQTERPSLSVSPVEAPSSLWTSGCPKHGIACRGQRAAETSWSYTESRREHGRWDLCVVETSCD